MKINVMSFSFKREVAPDADMLFDVRFLKNPHYEPHLQKLSGLDKAVGEHIESDPNFDDFYTKLTDMLTFMLENYTQKNREQFTVAIGCTGGKHRSVYVVEKVSAFLREHGYNVTIQHRDLEKSS